MLFNSIDFLLFFPVVCIVYWLLQSNMARNVFLLLASYYFYGSWKPLYLLLLIGCTLVTYFSSILLTKSDNQITKKIVLFICLFVNVMQLVYFKYFQFVADNIGAFMSIFDVKLSIPNFDILLPVGISFFVFQAIGYTLDVYYKKVSAETNIVRYGLFVSFFPQLVAGPIERSTHLLPQFKEKRSFNYEQAISGLKQILWGYIMKLVLADRCAMYVDSTFNNICENPNSIILTSVLFTFQIYGDFAGYSYIAIGTAKILGYSLNDNFLQPYLSCSVTDFWRRWHISLSTWLRDYIYIPLGGSRINKVNTYRNLLITFLVSGIWHGANFTFIVWGLLHGICLCLERLLGLNKSTYNGMKKIFHIIFTFIIINFTWLIFRSNSLSQFIYILSNMNVMNINFVDNKKTIIYSLLSILIVLIKDLYSEYYQLKYKKINSMLSLVVMMLIILWMGVYDGGKFIYFQF